MAANMERALPKFGEWDVNDPASAEGFSVIFNKARDEKRSSASSLTAPIQPLSYKNDRSYDHARPNKRWWCCCA